LVGNKADTLSGSKSHRLGEVDVLYISAQTGFQVELLKEKLVDLVLQGTDTGESTIVTNARHYAALQQVATSLTDIATGLRQGTPADLIALDIRRCLHFLGEITGAITNEDQLDYIFSKFCIGK
nr:tRNA uridine-5-carboxymethylaminomethyl(34) synthesis GTPase MnmE [Chitinophagaceae bacterium]